MTTSTKRLSKGFTLIELLTVIAIIGILAAIIIPTVGKVRETAQRTVAASNLRQIVQATSIYAADNNESLPQRNLLTTGTATTFARPSGSADSTDDKTFAAALALGGGLNDANIWIIPSDSLHTTTGLSTVLNATRAGLETAFGNATTVLGFQVVAGLKAGNSSTVPVAVTRGIQTAGTWPATTTSPYGSDGGHIGFLGGNVAFYRQVDTTNNALIAVNGTNAGNKVPNILQAIPLGTPGISGARLLATTNATGTISGPGIQ